MTIIEYFNGSFAYPVQDSVIEVALGNRDVSTGLDSYDVSINMKELVFADVLMTFVNSPSFEKTKTVANDFSTEVAGFSITGAERKEFRRIAQTIYHKYEDTDKYDLPLTAINI